MTIGYAVFRVHALDAGAAGVQVAHDIAHVGFGDGDLHDHDRLEQHRAGIVEGQLEGFAAGDFKGDWLRVDRVFFAVKDGDFHVGDRETGHDAFFHHARMPFSMAGM